MTVSLVLTVIGDDRPGLVDSLSTTVTTHGGNWLESRMARMAGKFAGILRVSVEEPAAAGLMRALAELEQAGLKLVIEQSEAGEGALDRQLLRLELVGQDRAGIVRDLSHALANRGVNVDELITECVSAPMSGEPLFKASARLRVPADVSIEDLRQTVERLSDELMVDVSLDHV